MTPAENFMYDTLKDNTVVIEKYKGTDKEVVIPSEIDGKKVTVIGQCAFYNNADITSVIIPEGITAIESCAFWGCKKITEITIPGTVKEIEYSAFSGCDSLTKATFCEGVAKISLNAFSWCHNLAAVTIPDSVTTIDSGAFYHCENFKITIPDTVTSISKDAFEGCNKEKITISKAWVKSPSHKKVDFVNLKKEGFAIRLAPEDYAYLFLTQTAKTTLEYCNQNLEKLEKNKCVELMTAVCAEVRNEKSYTKAAEYVLEHKSELSEQSIKSLYDTLISLKSKKAVLLLKELVSGEVSAEQSDSPYSWIYEKYNEHTITKKLKEQKIPTTAFDTVKLANSEEKAPFILVVGAILPYTEQFTSEQVKGYSNYKTQEIKAVHNPFADKAASMLDIESLLSALEPLIGSSLAAIVPYCRYADGARVEGIIAKLKEWAGWYEHGINGRKSIMVARGGLFLNDTIEALRYFDKIGMLDRYAELRNTSSDEVSIRLLQSIGLDENGTREFDLGSKKLAVTLSSDMTFTMIDLDKNKEVKSVPKKDVDPDVAKRVSTEISAMKKQIKEVCKNRTKQLFDMFLNGETYSANSWKAQYSDSSVTRGLAKILVWSQGKNTFTISEDNKLITSSGNEYTLDDTTPVGVANPFDMERADVLLWREYFLSKKLKQAFLQVWEPVVDP